MVSLGGKQICLNQELDEGTQSSWHTWAQDPASLAQAAGLAAGLVAQRPKSAIWKEQIV